MFMGRFVFWCEKSVDSGVGILKPNIIVYACDSSTRENEERRSQVWGQPELHSKILCQHQTKTHSFWYVPRKGIAGFYGSLMSGYNNTCTPVFIAALSTIVLWQLHRYPTTDELIKKMWYKHRKNIWKQFHLQQPQKNQIPTSKLKRM
jgi:hypothetical protein